MQNNQLRSFMDVIQLALTSQDLMARPQAQAKIIHYRDTNPSQFFMDCSLIVSSQQFSNAERQSAGTVASRLLNMKIGESEIYYWDEVNPQMKLQIKQNCLSVLINPARQVMRSAANIIAVIASIQLPRNEWQQIVDILAENCTNQDINIKNASITTLGYICEQIKKSGKTINDRLSEQILGSIIMGARQGGEYMKASLKALEDSMPFLHNLMQQGKYRDVVFQVFIDNFSTDLEIEDTYNALFEFAKAASSYLMNYSKALTDLADIHLIRRDEYANLNLQLWEVIGVDYSEKMTNAKERINDQKIQDNFLQSVSQILLPQIMKCLLILNKDEQQSDDLRTSASRALEAFAKVCDITVVDNITASVSTILQSSDPYQQQATVPLFSTICEYPDKSYVQGIFKNGFEHLFALLQSQNQTVVRNSLIGFVRLAEMVPQVFLSHNNIPQIIDTIMDYVRVQHKDIRYIAIQILANISEGLKQTPKPVCDNPTILLTKVVQYYSQNMQKLHTTQPQMNEKTIGIIMNIVINSNKREVIVQLIEFMMEEYNKIVTGQMQNTAYLIEQILSVLHTSVLAHKDSIPNNDLMGKLCNLIDYHINKYGVEGEGLSMLGAMATTFQKAFETRANKYWDTVIRIGLQKVNQIATFKAALACVGDFARMMESCFFNHSSEVMNQLLGCIQDNLDREIKLSIICCMGDLFLSIQEYTCNFIDEVIKICDLSFAAVYQLTPNPQDMDYVEELKSNLIEMYSCVVFAANQKKVNKPLYDHYGNLATFIVRTCDKNVHPTVEYLKNCLYLLHDSVAFYWNGTTVQNHDKIRDIIGSNQVGELVRLIKKFEDRKDIKELIDFINSRKGM